MHGRPLLLLMAGLAAARADSTTDAAVALYRSRRYLEAQSALTAIVAAEPRNARACHYLGLALRRAGGDRALDQALPWLRKAAELAPGNAGYVGDYGGACLELADRHGSFMLATRGRDALERAVALDPGDLAARTGLMQFYARAPWPLGDSQRARREAAEIGRRSPSRGARAWELLGRIRDREGDRDGARSAYREALRLEPKSPSAAAALAAEK